MNLAPATKDQLYQIATDDDAPLTCRYEAARELQRRRLGPDKLLDLVRMWPGHTATEIAEHLALPVCEVIGAANKYGLIRRD